MLLRRKSAIENPKSESEDTKTGADFGIQIADFIPKITDFGLAKRWIRPASRRRAETSGYATYMAPEQASGKVTDPRPGGRPVRPGRHPLRDAHGPAALRGATTLDTLQQVSLTNRYRRRVAAEGAARPGNHLPEVPGQGARPALCFGPALADDLHRFLAGEAIQTCRGGGWCRTHGAEVGETPACRGGPAGADGLLLLLAVVGSGVSLWYSGRLADEPATWPNSRSGGSRQKGIADEAARWCNAARHQHPLEKPSPRPPRDHGGQPVSCRGHPRRLPVATAWLGMAEPRGPPP